jgi:uncharacterized membrane protein YdjX (TVP38/TMEM64 family)
VLVLGSCLLFLLGLALVPGVRDGIALVGELLAAGNLPALREYLRSFGLWAPVASVVLMQLQALVAPLPSFPLMYANGLLFGALWGGVLSWTSLFVSAVLCFGLARGFGRPLVARLVSPAALASTDRWVTRVGPFAVFLARLFPLTAFDLLSYAAGLTRMRLGPFCVATGLGMAPAIFLTSAAADLGLDRGWPLAAALLGLAVVGGGAILLRPSIVQRFGPPVEPALSRGRRTRPAAGGERAATGGPGTSPPAG